MCRVRVFDVGIRYEIYVENGMVCCMITIKCMVAPPGLLFHWSC